MLLVMGMVSAQSPDNYIDFGKNKVTDVITTNYYPNSKTNVYACIMITELKQMKSGDNRAIFGARDFILWMDDESNVNYRRPGKEPDNYHHLFKAKDYLNKKLYIWYSWDYIKIITEDGKSWDDDWKKNENYSSDLPLQINQCKGHLMVDGGISVYDFKISEDGNEKYDLGNYIDTEYIPTPNTRVEACLEITEHRGKQLEKNQGIFGCEDFILWLDPDKNLYFRRPGDAIRDNVVKLIESKKNPLNKKLYISYSGNNMKVSTEDLSVNVDTSWIKNDHNTFTHPICINKIENHGMMDGAIKLYSFKIYEGDVLKKDYVPAYGLEKGYPVLYDLKNDEFASIDYDNLTSPDDSKKLEKCKNHRYIISDDENLGFKSYHCIICGHEIDLTDWNNDLDGGLEIIDPMLDMEVDSSEIGLQKFYVISAGGSLGEVTYYVGEKGKEELVYASPHNFEENITFKELSLNPVEKTTPVTGYIVSKKVNFVGTQQDTIIVFTPFRFNQKPYHRVHNAKVGDYRPVDKQTGVQTERPSSLVTFEIVNPKDEDVISNDMFFVMRSFNDDFSDEEIISNLSFSDTIKTVTRGSVMYGQFSYRDETNLYDSNNHNDAGTYCAISDAEIDLMGLSTAGKEIVKDFYTSPDRHVNYRIARAVDYGIWPDARRAYAEVKFKPTVQLPPVSEIHVVKDSEYDHNGKVTLQVKLKSPYLWDVVNKDDSTKVRDYLETKGDPTLIRRQYLWNPDAEIKIERYSEQDDWDSGEDFVRDDLTINGSQVKWDKDMDCYYAEISDIQGVPGVGIHYKAVTSLGNSAYPLAINNPECLIDKSEVYKCDIPVLVDSVMASQGQKGQIDVSWTRGTTQPSSVVLERRLYSADGSKEWTQLLNDKDASSYTDYDVAPGEVYEYRVTAKLMFHGKEFETVRTGIGWCDFYGTIAGVVIMKDGTGLANAKVTITRENPIVIPEVKDSDGKVVLKGVEEKKLSKVLYSNENGFFRTDSLLYVRGTSSYSIHVTYGSDIECEGNNTIQLTNSQCVYDDLEYICNDTKRISGRVLYAQSTVPVQGVNFRMTVGNDTTTIKKNIQNVTTDQDGNFSFYVPSVSLKIQAFKDGHKFTQDGYINGNQSWTPVKDLAEVIVSDSTKVRLVGRISGGTTEGDKQIGFGLSKNIIGDDLQMVLQLEGNNTAQLVYKKDDPDDTKYETVLDNPYKNNGNEKYDKGKTKANWEKKRIIISPDSKTGEFFVDLFPTKYKITQLSAKGYSTLYAEGEGIEVLDLSNNKILNMRADTLKNNPSVKVEYNAHYNRIFHAPVAITTEQVRYGRKYTMLGEEYISDNNKLGKKFNAKMYDKFVKQKSTVNSQQSDSAVSATTDTVEYKYIFGYPVYRSNQKYTFRFTAHEDFYYNNDKNGKLVQVPIKKGTLHLQNGLLEGTNKDQTYELDSLGGASVVLAMANDDFSRTGENALRNLTMQVEIGGYYYEAEPIKAFVLGSRNKGTDVLATADADITILDYIRDPYGSGSFAYREKGTQYNWTNDYSLDLSGKISVAFEKKPSLDVLVGLGVSKKIAISSYNPANGAGITINTPGAHWHTKGEYHMTLNDRISTSSDPLDVGAMADVYVGTINSWFLAETENLAVIDDSTYNMVKPAIESGAIKLVASGKTADKEEFHIVIADKLGIGKNVKSTFAYSQKHILGTIIPDLEKTRDELLRKGTETEIRNLANDTKVPQYWDKGNGTYQMITPEGYKGTTFDVVNNCNNMITRWRKVIENNEKEKLTALNVAKNDSDFYKNYNIAGSEITHTEAASTYYQFNYNTTTPSITGSGVYNSSGAGKKGTKDDYDEQLRKRKGEEPDSVTVNVKSGGLALVIKVAGSISFNTTRDLFYHKVFSKGSGYTLKTNDNSYLNMDVISRKVDSDNLEYHGEEEMIFRANDDDDDINKAKPHNFVFYVNGGAERDPWYAPDSTLFYKPGQPLGVQTLKIDNPKITIDKPVVSNVPEDETAKFTVRMTNDSEVPDKTQYLAPSKFVLAVDDKANANGAGFVIDGVPFRDMTFVIAPGQTLTKTLEVKRGDGYDFNDLMLIFRDNANSIVRKTALSVHFIPQASPVKLTAPRDKWVMNTLSAQDKSTGAYYMPVEITGFNTNADGFHHIELQYKKHTEGESEYVNICSFFDRKDSLYYKEASGVKEYMDGGTINYRFYGEKDPVEMEYDIRAVTFKKFGDGFVTRSSDIMYGVKDTRVPEVFGLPTPTNSILTYNDVLQLNFTEPIAYNYLDKTANFEVTGYSNETDIQNSSTLHFSGADDQKVVTTVDRSLKNRSFTVDMMIKPEKSDMESYIMPLLSHGVTEGFGLSFIIGANGSIYTPAVYWGGKIYICKHPFTVGNWDVPRRVGFAYDYDTNTITFYDGLNVLEKIVCTDAYNKSAKISLGETLLAPDKYKGEMLEVRIWNKALSADEWAKHHNKHLNGYNDMLIANWSLTETEGNVAHDRINGADLTLKGTSWNTIKGKSLKTIDENPVELVAKDMAMDVLKDYTLEFWFNVESIDSVNAKAKKNMPTEFALFRNGNQFSEEGYKMFAGFANDSLILRSNGNTFALGDASAYSTGWHHFALIVDRAHNAANIYLDKKLVLEGQASLVGGLATDYAALGDTCMVASFDNFILWEKALTDHYVKEYYNTTLSGKEMGLKVYMPFEEDKTNDQNIFEKRFSPNSIVMTRSDEGKWSKKTTVMLKDYAEDLNYLASDINAPLTYSPAVENLDFSWSSTGTALQINLNEKDSKINKQYVNITVRGVEDLRGNSLESPVMWSCFVDKCMLRWVDPNLEMTTMSGQETSARAYWKNTTGNRLYYEITDLPDWLTIADNKTSGTANAEQESYIVLETAKGIGAGTYSGTIRLTDENGLSDNLNVSLTVMPNDPGWKVNNAYDRTMNLMAKVTYMVESMLGVQQFIIDDPDDKVGAFIGGECVGLANITNDANGAYLFMTVYADSLITSREKDAREITFLHWNHKNGVIHQLDYVVGEEDDVTKYGHIYFQVNSSIGLPPNQPIELRQSDFMMQTLDLNDGWNWVSFNVSPRAATGYNSIFIAPDFSDADVIKVKNVDFNQYSEKYRDWMGTLSPTDFHNVLQIYVQHGGLYKLMGKKLTQDDLEITVNKGWNDMPYLLTEALPLQSALADFEFGHKAVSGDIIKSLDEFAVVDVSRNTWVGTLKYLNPGKGYYLNHFGEPTSFSYSYAQAAAAKTRAAAGGQKSENTELGASKTPYFKNEMMPVIAVFADDVDYQEGDSLVAMSGEERVGHGEVVDGKFFVAVHGDGDENIRFALVRNGEIIAKTTKSVQFSGSAMLGSLKAPLVISFNDDFDANADGNTYDVLGRRVNDVYQGIIIKNGKKELRK